MNDSKVLNLENNLLEEFKELEVVYNTLMDDISQSNSLNSIVREIG